jgi:uncharacterized protein
MSSNNVKELYKEAVSNFISKIKSDQNVIAAILCGSLSYDDVWKKSDVDMTLIVRDQKLSNNSYCLVEDGIIINVSLIERSNFRRSMEWSTGGSQIHSYFAKGQIIYSTDDSLYGYFESIKKPGKDDIQVSAFIMCSGLIGVMHKCEKWLKVKKNLSYCQYYILKAAELVAAMEVCMNSEIPTREAILRAKEINPELMKCLYDDPMSTKLEEVQLLALIRKIDDYIESHLDLISGPALEYMSDGEIKTITVLSKRFKVDTHYIVDIFEYLSDKGIIEKLSETIKITPKSKLAVEEVAYVYPGVLF